MRERARLRGGLVWPVDRRRSWRRVAALPVELSAEQRQAARSEEREQRYLAAARLGAPPHVDGRRRVEAVLRPLLRLRLDGEPRRERGEAARVPLSPSSGSARAGNRFGGCGEGYSRPAVEMAGNRWGEERRKSPRAVGRGAGVGATPRRDEGASWAPIVSSVMSMCVYARAPRPSAITCLTR